jgi:hypothetical protein
MVIPGAKEEAKTDRDACPTAGKNEQDIQIIGS